MVKRVYIIQAKLSLGRTQQLVEFLESEQEYEKIESCAHADYIVTELKSPVRIMRNVKKSTCPIIHVTWVLESIRLKKQLNPEEFLIDVSDAKKQVEIDILARISARALPRQLTWDQVALRRLNKKSFENDSYLAKNAGLKERSQFFRAYSSRYIPTRKILNKTGLSRTRLVDQGKDLQPSLLTDASPSTANNCSDAAHIDKSGKETPKNTLPIFHDGSLGKRQAFFAGIDNITSLKNTSGSLDDIVNGSCKSKFPNVAAVIRDNIYNEDKEVTTHNERIVIEDNSDIKVFKEAEANSDLNMENDNGFSITASKELPTKEFIHRDESVTDKEKFVCSTRISDSLTVSFDNGASESESFNVSSISSVEFDASQYSLSAILSL